MPRIDIIEVRTINARDLRVRIVDLAERVVLLAYVLPLPTLAASPGKPANAVR
jgi:hypothetical protein